MAEITAEKTRVQVLSREHWIVAGILLFAFFHGLLYTFIVPPWQHYEEPSHFEYAWIIADRMGIPPRYTYDNRVRAQIAQSMEANGFFRDLGFKPDPNATDGPIWIGINVVGAVPLYHIYEAIPIKLLSGFPIDTQLYGARLFSLILFIGIVLTGYLIAAELVPPGHIIRWATPLTLALLPGFVDMMTALNNDVGATFCFSLFIWASVRLILRGLSLRRVLAVAAAALLCALTKNTVIVAVPLALLVLFLGAVRWRPSPYLWLAPLAIFAVVGLLIFRWGDAAYWYRSTDQPEATQAKVEEAPDGSHAIRIDLRPDGTIPSVSQPLPGPTVHEYRGKQVTVGAWVWASQPLAVQAPTLVDGTNSFSQTVEVDTHPKFVAYQATIASQAQNIRLLLQPGLAPGEPVSVYYDGVVVAGGSYPLDRSPAFDRPDGSTGQWGGSAFTNLVRNGTGESGWLWIQPWAEGVFKKFAQPHLAPSILFDSLQDTSTTVWVLRVTAINLYQTFWAKFGWSSVKIPLTGYLVLKYFSAFVIIVGGAGVFKVYLGKDKPFRVVMIFLGIALATMWGITLVRGLFTMTDDRIYIPTARYAYPAIIPVVLCILAGPREWFKRFKEGWVISFVLGLVSLDIVSLMTLLNHYNNI